ncbi:unnamed protein product [Lupinus luteus]|uniref:Uncharacterized protein n=1 Tax=Lupinus luteus TaxID=3873 RepID=A0AAV1XPJ0_LUPLU
MALRMIGFSNSDSLIIDFIAPYNKFVYAFPATLLARNALSAYQHISKEPNCIAFVVSTIFIVDASTGGFVQKQLAHSANLTFLDFIHWFDKLILETKIGDIRCSITCRDTAEGKHC